MSDLTLTILFNYPITFIQDISCKKIDIIREINKIIMENDMTHFMLLGLILGNKR